MQSIAFAKDEIRTFADKPEMTVENYKELYSELKMLMKQTKKFIFILSLIIFKRWDVLSKVIVYIWWC